MPKNWLKMGKQAHWRDFVRHLSVAATGLGFMVALATTKGRDFLASHQLRPFLTTQSAKHSLL